MELNVGSKLLHDGFSIPMQKSLHLKSNPQQFGLHLRLLQIASNSTLVKVQEESAEQELSHTINQVTHQLSVLLVSGF